MVSFVMTDQTDLQFPVQMREEIGCAELQMAPKPVDSHIEFLTRSFDRAQTHCRPPRRGPETSDRLPTASLV
ncbi:MAG: hypothetical protein Fues2KO_42730 [Fuerstiella sp.]